ncbi:glycosyltransferase family 2 protein [Mycobacterium paragordonae]|uniref:Glycosyltransferase family 2 protein n=1 Tax=Mycobacterium paragordonae TaxID=1389713 RepID=A0A4V3AX25_9MYCO|nr:MULTISPECIES: glycosyltransferase family 2 protein [Mycobacterium]MDP7735369.1 glycosyltransferase family 2 protein [Mycobacterium paragordonae]OBJ79379.1 glycosyl transferase [Mycobacterium gordonae]OBK60170.1 glycosyl transferase [Mycobacterium gordonae]TDK93476.1 glycosyltransferase [Mycobacterium paragordonae]TDL04921.1 glycosyltransferase [Mycobacterium paragordonae]
MKKKIAVISPAYNESECIEELARQLAKVFDSEPAYDFEAIIVENGSTDDTMEKLLAIRAADPRFKIVKLARNFRMDGGLTAGLNVVDADAVVLMTADLQDPPEFIPEMIRAWEQGYENVYGVVTERGGVGLIRRMNSQLFYWLAGRLTDDRITRNASDFRLVDRKVYEAVRSMDERNRFVRGLFSWVGFKSIGLPMKRAPRFAGESKAYTFKVMDLAGKGILAHSYVPLRLISLTGFLISALAAILVVLLTVRVLIYGVPFPGYGSLICAMLIGFGVITLLLGVVGEYLALIYEEVKQRPNFVITEKVGL